MRLSDEDFEDLFLLEEFSNYYDSLNIDEVVEEVERLRSEDRISRGLFQNCAIHKRLTDAACFDTDLNENARNSVIMITTTLRETIERVILPRCNESMQEKVRGALASTDDYVDRFSYYPRAVLMISLGARKPSGPYDMGVVGKVLSTA